MSLIDLQQPLIYPYWNPNAATFPTATITVTLDNAADRVGVMFSAPKTGYLDRMEFSLSSTPTFTGNLKVGWQDINLTTGLPDGTFTHWSDFSTLSSGWTYTMGYFGSGGKDTGTRKYVNAGDLVAFIISAENLTGTISIPVRHQDLGTSSVFSMCSYPRGVNNLTGSMTTNNDALGCALFYDNTVYTPPTFVQSVDTAWNTSTTPKTTASFAVQVGDVLVAHGIAENATAAATPAVRSISSTTYAGRTDTTITAPSGIADGDFLILLAIAAQTAGASAVTLPSGFTNCSGSPWRATLDGFSVDLYAAWKVASGESGDYTFTTPLAAYSQGAMLAISGGDTATTPAATRATGTGTTSTATTITTTANDSMVIFVDQNWQLFGAASVPGGTTPTFTEQLDAGTSLMYVATGVLATAGATGDKSHGNQNTSGDAWQALLIKIEAESGVSLGTPTNSGTALTWTLRKRELAATYTEVAIWTATATAAESITVDFSEVSATYRFGGSVLTFRGSSGVGASAGEHAASGEPSTIIVTTQPNSAIVVAIGDQTATDNDDIIWEVSDLAGTQTTYFNDPSHYSVYGAYYEDSGPTIGNQTVGIAETYTIKYSLAAVEIKAASTAGSLSPTPFSAGMFTPFNGTGSVTVSTAGARILGNLFELPFKCRVSGVYVTSDLDADMTVRLYASDGVTDLLGGAVVVDKDVPGASSGAAAIQWVLPSSVTLDANTQYRLALENTTATAVAMHYQSFGRDPGFGIDHSPATPGGSNWYYTTASVAHGSLTLGSWAEDVNRQILLSLIIDQIDDGISGYGGAFNAAWAVNANSVLGAGAVQ